MKPVISSKSRKSIWMLFKGGQWCGQSLCGQLNQGSLGSAGHTLWKEVGFPYVAHWHVGQWLNKNSVEWRNAQQYKIFQQLIDKWHAWFCLPVCPQWCAGVSWSLPAYLSCPASGHRASGYEIVNKSFIVVTFYNLQARCFHPCVSLVHTSVFQQTLSCSSRSLLCSAEAGERRVTRSPANAHLAVWWTAAKIKPSFKAQCTGMETCPVAARLSTMCLRYCQWEGRKAALSNNFFSFIFVLLPSWQGCWNVV